MRGGGCCAGWQQLQVCVHTSRRMDPHSNTWLTFVLQSVSFRCKSGSQRCCGWSILFTRDVPLLLLALPVHQSSTVTCIAHS